MARHERDIGGPVSLSDLSIRNDATELFGGYTVLSDFSDRDAAAAVDSWHRKARKTELDAKPE